MVAECACSSRSSSALRSAAVANVSRDNATTRVLPVLRCTTSALYADFSHQQEPTCHGKSAAASGTEAVCPCEHRWCVNRAYSAARSTHECNPLNAHKILALHWDY